MRYVCSNCLRCSCWLGIFMCDESRGASLYRARKVDLLRMGLENEDWMDEQSALVPRHDKGTPLLPRTIIRERLTRSTHA